MKTLLSSLSLLVLLCCQIPAGATSSGCFSSSTESSMSGPTPVFPVVADFNHDGIPDIAVANASALSVTVLYGFVLPDGSYAYNPVTGSPFQVGETPGKLVVADFNRDGNLDIAVACSTSASLEILFGNGQGGFKEPTAKYAVGASASQLATADFTGDGRPDLAVVNPNTSDVRIFIGVSGGGFNYLPSVKLVGSNPHGIAVGDFNGDGHTDFAVTSSNTNTVEVFLGDGTGHFTVAYTTPVATGGGPAGIVAGDFNRDGKIDLVTANQTGRTFTFLAGNGAGGFAGTTIPIPSGVAPQELATADVNGDGFLDLVTTNYGANTASVFLGNGGGGFAEAPFSPLVTGSTPTGVAIADLDNDRRLDIVVANQGSNSISRFLKGCPNELDAQNTASSYYAQMNAGQSYNVSLTMLNTGARAWSYPNHDRLGSRNPRDNFTWGNFNRVALPKGTVVPPGSSYTFSFTVTAPTTPGTYHFQWQMVEEHVAWFGGTTSDAIVTVH